ncbi:MAG: ribosome recycling factor [Coriobacteriia bacterium]|nr:ribosome recycling factor [Coriobacteriia bacterium]MBN2822780.1 ribosome recycling factor [Coriobacteriia bacterium]
MTQHDLADAKDRMSRAVASLGHEFAGVRTGRASGSIFEKISVEYYGVPTPMLQIASVSSPEAQLLVISPYDKSAMPAIEKAILASDLGLNPSNDGNVIRVPFPPLTEERRKDLVKLCKQYAEEARVAIRNIRRDSNEYFKNQEKEHEISQDDLHRLEADVQKTTDSFIADIDELLKRKEQEIMEV